MKNPNFEHRSKGCTYLGTYLEIEGEAVLNDLYYCHDGDRPSVEARYGNHPGDVHTGFDSSFPSLKEAKKRAEKRGFSLIKP